MAENLTIDFLHNYILKEVRTSDPIAYQYDLGRILVMMIPDTVSSVEVHYWKNGMSQSEAYNATVEAADKGSVVTAHVPNKYFETSGDLRVYVVIAESGQDATMYEGLIPIKERPMPDGYVDDDPDNTATHLLVEARAAAATATAAAKTAQDVADSIPADYTQLSEDVDTLKEDLENIKGKGGLTEDAKQALLTCFRHIAFLDDESDYYGALESALYPPADLVSISCVYTQTVTVYTDTALDDLRSDLVVTAHFDDSSTRTISQYALSGTLEVGTSTITVSYGGKTTEFDVVVEKGLDYTEDALSNVTWNAGKGYSSTTHNLIDRNGAYTTDKFTVQDLSYSVRNLDTSNNTTFYIYVWDDNNNYLGQKQQSDARFQWKPGYQIAIEVRNAGTFDPTTMTMLPYDKRSTAVNEFEIDLAAMASSVVKANGYYELNVNAVMANAGVNSSNYNDTINRQSIIGMINQSVFPNNFPFSTPIRIGTFNYGANMLLSINVEGIAVSDANLPTLKAYLVDNNVKIKYNY